MQQNTAMHFPNSASIILSALLCWLSLSGPGCTFPEYLQMPLWLSRHCQKGRANCIKFQLLSFGMCSCLSVKRLNKQQKHCLQTSSFVSFLPWVPKPVVSQHHAESNYGGGFQRWLLPLSSHPVINDSSMRYKEQNEGKISSSGERCMSTEHTSRLRSQQGSSYGT